MENYIPKVGDKVRIKKGGGWNDRGKMDHFIGREVIITGVRNGVYYEFDGDTENHFNVGQRWAFLANCFDFIEKPCITTFKFC